jgi:hypothetical protein
MGALTYIGVAMDESTLPSDRKRAWTSTPIGGTRRHPVIAIFGVEGRHPHLGPGSFDE